MPIGADAKQDVVAPEPWLEIAQIGGDQRLDQLPDARALGAPGHQVGGVLQHRQRVGHRNPALAEVQEGVIVLGVADADHVVGRQTELAERLGEAGRLAQARRQHHHGVFVERHVQLEPEIADDLEDRGLVGLPCRHDHPADGDRGHTALPQRADKRFGRRLAEELFLARCRAIDDSAVLCDDPIEQLDVRTDREQILQLAAGDEDQPTARVT